MSNQHKALQCHVDVPRRDEFAPVISTIRRGTRRTGGTTRDSDANRTPTYADVGSETMTPDVILMYRARIASGVYDAPASIAAVAEALRSSGDL
ncbi:MAG: hypothetical protein MNPFHGCM_01784 [Gemmatimonadaceae bacterium]|nr:hypothetical protein [Gemmatimonadaceae bacterium]